MSHEVPEQALRERTDEARAGIAVIEDDEDTSLLLSARLRSLGHDVICYGDAESALEAMHGGRRPDLILLDLMLPGMSGWDFRVRQKEDPSLLDIPVVVLSGVTASFAAAIDAAACLTKPLDTARLANVVQHVLSVSARRRETAHAIKRERTDALSMLVASISHEINEPLGRMLMYLDRAIGWEASEPRGYDDERTGLRESSLKLLLEKVRSEAERVTFAVGLLNTFGQENLSDNDPVTDPLRALDAATRLAAHQMEGRAHVVAQLEAVPLVRVAEGRLAHAIFNLLLNAAQAIPEGAPDKHEIRVRVMQVEAGASAHEHYLKRSLPFGTRDVLIEVEDTGCGMAPETISRIFEPFYTTKPAGTCTGLGLTIARDIVEQFGGFISAKSELGRGSTFGLRLPVYQDDLRRLDRLRH